MKSTQIGMAIGMAIAVTPMAACTQSPAPAPTTPGATPTVDARQNAVDGATHAYYEARKTLAAMALTPQKTLAEYPADLKIKDYLTDPALHSYVKDAAGLVDLKWSIKYEMGLSAPTVKSVDLAKKTIILSHCPTDEKITVTENGQATEIQTPPGAAPAPNRVTYTMVEQGGRWKLGNTVTDQKSTCHTD